MHYAQTASLMRASPIALLRALLDEPRAQDRDGACADVAAIGVVENIVADVAAANGPCVERTNA